MKSLIVFALCAVVALAAPQRQASSYGGDEKQAQVLTYNNDVDVHRFQTAVETSNGIKSEDQGQLINEGKENEAFVRSGQYSYPGPDGVTYSVVWTADENGFHPQGAHIPV